MKNFNIVFDPHFEKEENVRSVTINHTDLDSRHGCYIFRNGPMQRSSIRITKNGVPLVENEDFLVGHRYHRGTHVTAQQLITSIYLKNPTLIPGVENWKITGHYLGGDYLVSEHRIADYLESEYISANEDNWEKVMGSDRYMPPIRVRFDVNNWVGVEDLITAIDRMKGGNLTREEESDVIYRIIEDRILYLSAIVNDPVWQEHMGQEPSTDHKLAPHTIGAVHKLDVAKNALKAFGHDLASFVNLYFSSSVSPADLESYISRVNESVATGTVTLRDNFCSITSVTYDTETVVDLSNGNLILACEGNIVVSSTGDVSLSAAENTLVLKSSGPAENALVFNGDVVLNSSNILKNLPDIDDVTIRHKDSMTLGFTGTGLASDPLKANLKHPNPTVRVAGTVVVTSDREHASSVAGATPVLAAELSTELEGMADLTSTVNAHTLVNDVQLTLTDIELSNVDNTSDLNKPISVAMRYELDDLADTEHEHIPSDFGILQATESNLGGARTTDGVTGGLNDAVNPFSTNKLYQELKSAPVDITGYLPGSVLDAGVYHFDDRSLDATLSGYYTVTIPSARYYRGRRWTIIPETVIDVRDRVSGVHSKSRSYFHVTNSADGPYVVSNKRLPNTPNRTYLGMLYTPLRPNSDPRISITEYVLRLGLHDELRDHMEEMNPHGWSLTAENFNLDNLENKPLAKEYSDLFAEGVNEQYVSIEAFKGVLDNSNCTYITGTVMSGVRLPIDPDKEIMAGLAWPTEIEPTVTTTPLSGWSYFSSYNNDNSITFNIKTHGLDEDWRDGETAIPMAYIIMIKPNKE